MSALTIAPAEHGGFVVWSEASYGDRAHYARPMLFAGSLTDCLEFVRSQLATLPPAAPEVRKAA